MRIYPNHLLAIPDEPRAEDFRVAPVDKARGLGVVVLRYFRKNEILFRMNGRLTREITQYSLQLADGLHLDDPDFAGRTLHSCEPNSRLDPATRLFVALRDIRPGDLLTMDYDETEDVLFRSFWCQCGAGSCRGFISGRLARTPLAVVDAAENMDQPLLTGGAGEADEASMAV